MKKFWEYVILKDRNWEYIFPSPIGHFVLTFLVVISFGIYCNREKKDKIKRFNTEIEIDTTYSEIKNDLNNTKISDSVFSVSKSKYWSSKEIKLPIGIIYALDCANSNTKEASQDDNYVTVKRLDGSLSVTRDIDVDLYLNLHVGDTIK